MKRHYSGTPRETIPLRILDFFIDIYVRWFYRKREKAPISAVPKVLIASLGHMGDALTVSYMFPIIRQKYPNAIIDIISPSWCKAVNEHNPYVRHTLVIDHYLSNRNKIGFWQKLKRHYQTFKEVLPFLRDEHYDFYLDVRTSYGVSHFVLPFTNVTKAVGFNRRGMGGFLDVELEIPRKDGNYHHFEAYAALLKEIGVDTKLEEVVPYFTIDASITWEQVQSKLPLAVTKPYILLFPETGEAHRQMSNSFWINVLKEVLEKSDYSVVLCGQTDLSAQIVKGIDRATASQFSEKVIDASKKLSIQELAFLSTKAEFALTLDSFPEHLCCIFCETITIYKASGLPFFPIANYPVLLFHTHFLSKNAAYIRRNVTVHYREKIETPDVSQLIVAKITAEKKVL
ncbi:glycosyltransferase family 9 protein [Runella salmonicolor]|uniref:Lipopolysaccharide heptosyltransferase family protein n=1 Tax=Runella salmonicolor TaxID=2950278 RepID=A0ABT1FVF2_9BACT|nr:glycosyltransferase family 9 protein [Runella salmonicolor]MCP1385748.1 lipopolysaccharide heptosyltransferase family protein [Runella salmonicolor]